MVVAADQAAISSAIVKIDDAPYLSIYFVSCFDGSLWLRKKAVAAVGVVLRVSGGGGHCVGIEYRVYRYRVSIVRYCAISIES